MYFYMMGKFYDGKGDALFGLTVWLYLRELEASALSIDPHSAS